MTLYCDVIPLWAISDRTRDDLVDGLCWPGSDFHGKIAGSRSLTADDGTISIVRDERKGIVGWARSERWIDEDGLEWATLEAFVREHRRGQGIAAFAAAGLVPGVFADEGHICAVFSPPMLLVAARASLHPTLFQRSKDKRWRMWAP